MYKDPALRKLAGIPDNLQKDLREEKVDLSISDIFTYLERCLYGNGYYGYSDSGVAKAGYGGSSEKDEPTMWDVALSCLDALAKKGYDAGDLKSLRSYVEKMAAGEVAKKDANKAMEALRRQRWDKAEVY